MLKKMRDAMLTVGFGSRARSHENTNGRCFEPRHTVRYDPHPVAELAYLNCHG
jgi:hypothetical protein